jgi:pimeloyl-ACP methyl ester carboxylesterase
MSARSVAPVWPGDRAEHLFPKDREVVTGDGTRIRYTVLGPAGAPWVVCCAGYLCPDNFWAHLAPALATDHRVLILDYRGVGASTEAEGAALPQRPEDYRLERLADDVAAAMDAEDARAASVVGHSMGTQVALALWRVRPDLVARLALLAGPHASPMHTLYGTEVARYLFPLASIGMPALPRAAGRVLMRALELPVALPVGRVIRALGPHTPDEGMRTYRWHMSRVDPRTAIWTARGMHAFDARPWLHEVDVPTLVVVGERDAWCPPEVGDAIDRAIPHARLVRIAGASHALPIEFPDLVIDAVRAHLAS